MQEQLKMILGVLSCIACRILVVKSVYLDMKPVYIVVQAAWTYVL